jgi:hypothetical protein
VTAAVRGELEPQVPRALRGVKAKAVESPVRASNRHATPPASVVKSDPSDEPSTEMVWVRWFQSATGGSDSH